MVPARQFPAVSPAQRHALLYAMQFFAFGVMLPFLPAVLAERGLDPTEVGIVLSGGSAVRLLAGPAGGRVADALAAPKAVLVACAAVSALACMGFLVGAGFVAMLAVHAVLSSAMAPIMPLTDSMTLASIREYRFDYGRARAAGSVTFILGSLAAGQAVGWSGTGVAVPMMAAGLLAASGAAALLPRVAATAGGPRGLAGFLQPLTIPALRWLILVSALTQGAHAFYYGFGTLTWQQAGIPAGTIGALWAVGVIAEIALFIWGRRLVERLGPVRLSLIAGAAGVLRWALTALTADLLVLFPLQVLHAGTFGAQHLATMMVLGRIVPGPQAGTAQALHASLGSGLSMGVLTLLCGPLFAAYGGGGFLFMALLCAASVPATLAMGRALRR